MKLEENMLKNIDSTIYKHNFSTRTEFIRTAIREKLIDLDKEEAIKAILRTRGIVKTQTTDAERRKIREQALAEMIEEKGWKL